MPRAKRYYIPGCVWHITHRCHKKESLLNFATDRSRWLELLYKAKQRYGLVVLDYIVTSNTQAHSEWVEDALKADKHEHDRKWSQAVGIGSESYIENIKKNLGVRGIHRETNASRIQVIFAQSRRAKILERTCYSSDFATSGSIKSNQNPSAYNVILFLREP